MSGEGFDDEVFSPGAEYDSGDELGELSDGDDEFDDGVFEPSVYGPASMAIPEKGVSMNAQDMIGQIQQNIRFIADACSTDELKVTLGMAGALLKSCKFEKADVLDQWIQDKDALLAKARIQLSTRAVFVGIDTSDDTLVECPICWGDVPPGDFLALPCKHFVCKDCWIGVLHSAIESGPTCLLTQCPFTGADGRCQRIVTEEMFKKCCNEADSARYEQFLLRSFVADNPRVKWCPAPGCEKAVVVPLSDVTAGADSIVQIECECGTDFCFACQREWHDTCSCKEVTDWHFKVADSEGGVALYMKSHTKPCPGCKKPIEKNEGCLHMTCSQCSHEFCWLCMGPWAPHGTEWYNCTRFDPKKRAQDEAEMGAAAAELKRLEHYMSRYIAHHGSVKIMRKALKNAPQKISEFCKANRVHVAEGNFIKDVVEVLVECYRVLKYSYIHAFHMESSPRKDIFEMLQGDLERDTNQLAGLIEQPLRKIEQTPCLLALESALNRMTNLQSWKKEDEDEGPAAAAAAAASKAASASAADVDEEAAEIAAAVIAANDAAVEVD